MNKDTYCPMEDSTTPFTRRKDDIKKPVTTVDTAPVHRCTCGGKNKCEDCPNRNN